MSDGYQLKNQNKIHFVTLTIVGWIDVFAYLEFKTQLIDNLKYCQKNKGLNIFAYVILTNHIHMICQTDEGVGLSSILRDFKSFTSKEIIKNVEKLNPERARWILNNFSFHAQFNRRNDRYQVWKHGMHAIELESPKFINQKLAYIHLNPVRAGIVDEASHYLYSSARDYEGKKGILDIVLLDTGPEIGYLPS